MAVIVDYNSDTNGYSYTTYNNANRYVGASFHVTDAIKLYSAQFYISKTGTFTGTMYAYLYAHTGTYGVDGKPTGSPLATSDGVDVSSFSTPTFREFLFTGTNRYALQAGTNYCIVTRMLSGGDTNNYLRLDTAAWDTHAGDCFDSADGTSWYVWTSSMDGSFYVYGDIISSLSASMSPSVSPSASISASLSPTPSASVSPSISPSLSASMSPSVSPSASISASTSPSVSPSASFSASMSPSISPSASISASSSASISPSASLSASVSLSISSSISASISPSISPSASPSPSMESLNATIRTLTPKLEIQWDGVNWTDETDYLINSMGDEQLTDEGGGGVAATLDLQLDNTTRRFSPTNSSSPLYAYLHPRIPLRLTLNLDLVPYRLFTGFIKNIHPQLLTSTCSIECYDNQVLVENVQTNGLVYENYRSDELLTVLAGLANLSASQYNFEVGEHVVNYGYFEDKNVWEVMGQIASAERGRVFFDRFGTLCFWNRAHYRTQAPIAILSRDDWILDPSFGVFQNETRNAVIVKAMPRSSFSEEVVWANASAQVMNPYSDKLTYLPALGQQDAWLDFEDPCLSFVTPIMYTDFIANTAADGSGDNVTDDIEVVSFTSYGNAAFITLKNNNPQAAYFTKFQIRGVPVKVISWIRVTAIDWGSVDRYGRKELTIENNFVDSEASAWEIAQEELYRGRFAINTFKIKIVGHPQITCGTIVTVEEIVSTYKNYLVKEISWSLDENGFSETLKLIKPFLRPITISARASIIGASMSASASWSPSISASMSPSRSPSASVSRSKSSSVSPSLSSSASPSA